MHCISFIFQLHFDLSNGNVIKTTKRRKLLITIKKKGRNRTEKSGLKY